MSAAVNTLAAVRALGGDVKLGSPGRLKVIAPGPLPDELIQRLYAAKPDLLTLLTSITVDTWTDAEEERAAIIEYDGGAPRAWAEALARLDPSKPPNDVRPERWLRFIDDCGHFLDDGWAERAAVLGWAPLQLFGSDRKRPYYIPHRGLLWEVNGDQLIELKRDRAIMEVEGGGHRIYRRQPLEVGRVVLVWELFENLD
jgi:hypothetical protein